MREGVRIGLIGLGGMGQIHANHLSGQVEGSVLVGVADPVAAGQGMSEVRGAPVYADYQRLLDREVDALVVASSSTSHAGILKEVVSLGKPVFCEKPLALTLADSLGIYRLYQERGVPLQMGFMRRFDPQYRKAYEMIQAGSIGTPYHYSGISRDRVGPPLAVIRHSGGFFLDTGVHEFDLARWLLGTEIVSVFSRGALVQHEDYKEIHDVDQAHLSFRGASGAMGLVELSRDAVYGYDIRTEILGTRGSIQIARVNATGTVLLTQGQVIHDTYQDYRSRFREAYLAEMVAFVRAVREGTEPEVTSLDGIRATLVGEAAQRSLRSGHDESVSDPF